MKSLRKVIPIILLFFFVNDVLAQKTIKVRKLTLNEGLVCFSNNLTPVTGIVESGLLEVIAYESLGEEASFVIDRIEIPTQNFIQIALIN